MGLPNITHWVLVYIPGVSALTDGYLVLCICAFLLSSTLLAYVFVHFHSFILFLFQLGLHFFDHLRF